MGGSALPRPRPRETITPVSVRTIAVVTSSRADYGHLYWPLRELQEREDVETNLIVTGAHLSPAFGHTVDEIEADGFEVAERVECLVSADTDTAMATTMGLGLVAFGQVLGRMRPDLLLLIADRYEMLAPAAAALALRIPIVHIEGGERSEGAIDQAVRNAITAMAHVHLTTTELARERLIAMGEEPWRVHRVGAASLDHLERSPVIDRATLEAALGVDLTRPTILAAYHPVTLDRDPADGMTAVLAALRGRPEQIVFCYPNADAGHYRMLEEVRVFCEERPDAHLFVNLDPTTYWSLLRHVDLMYGNSSSGIMESASLGIPTIDIGRRQQGRERAANVIAAAATEPALGEALERGTSAGFRETARLVENPYGDGRSAPRIAEILANVALGDRLLEKRGRANDTTVPEPKGAQHASR